VCFDEEDTQGKECKVRQGLTTLNGSRRVLNWHISLKGNSCGTDMAAQYWVVVGLLDSFTENADASTLKEEAIALFERLDTDKNGSIDKEELMQGFPQLDANAAGILIAEADEDNDGSISFHQLWAIIQEATGQTAQSVNENSPTNVNIDAAEMQKTIIRLNAEVNLTHFRLPALDRACWQLLHAACERHRITFLIGQSPQMAGRETRCAYQPLEDGSRQSAHPRQGERTRWQPDCCW